MYNLPQCSSEKNSTKPDPTRPYLRAWVDSEAQARPFRPDSATDQMTRSRLSSASRTTLVSAQISAGHLSLYGLHFPLCALIHSPSLYRLVSREVMGLQDISACIYEAEFSLRRLLVNLEIEIWRWRVLTSSRRLIHRSTL